MSNLLRRSIDFDVTDAPMVAHALLIASTTAWMCGYPVARERAKALANQAAALMPAGLDQFDGDVWCEIGVALSTAALFSVEVEQPSWRRYREAEGYIVVTIMQPYGEVSKHRSRDMRHKAVPEALIDFLEGIAPIGCERQKAPADAD